MKNIFFLLIPFFVFSQSKGDKKLQKKLELEIVNKGLNIEDKFVIVGSYASVPNGTHFRYNEATEKNWNKTFFKSNLNTGSYSKEDGYLIIDGRYQVNIDRNSMTIKDASNNFKTVAFLEWKGPTAISVVANDKNKARRKFIIKSLIESN